jgi:O-antigen ligase
MLTVSQLFLGFGLFFVICASFLRNNIIVAFAIVSCLLYLFGGALRSVMPFRERSAFYVLVPCLIGFALSYNYKLESVFRDFIYFLIPLVFFFSGTTFRNARGDIESLVVKMMSLYSFIFLLFIVYQFEVYGLINRQLIRDNVSAGSFLSVLGSFAIFANLRRWWNGLSKACFFIFPLVLFLESSRTYVIVLFAFAVVYAIHKYWRQLLIFLPFILAILGLTALIFDQSTLTTIIVNKIIGELIPSEIWTQESMGLNYRAYEAQQGWKMFLDFPLNSILFGQGFGSLVPLDFHVLLGEVEYDAVPWVHNGYIYLLVKTGLIGLLCYILFFADIFRRAMGLRPIRYKVNVLGILMGLLISNLVICGVFSIQSAVAYVVLGYYYASGSYPSFIKRGTVSLAESVNK